MGSTIRIGELADRAGTTTRALRYYESRGLLTARRDAHGYRAYDEEDLRVLRQIRLLQEFGFDLEETRPFIECLRSGNPEGDSCPASREVYRAKLTELDALIDRLETVREAVRLRLSLAAESPESPESPEPSCELFPATSREGQT
jgi:DNA-binding transcriptional MerR regulator